MGFKGPLTPCQFYFLFKKDIPFFVWSDRMGEGLDQGEKKSDGAGKTDEFGPWGCFAF